VNILLIIVFAVTLLYLSMTERFPIYASLIGLQGVLLFFLSLLELNTITLATLIFVSVETLVFKVMVVPWFLFRIIRKTGETKVHEKAMPGFYSLFFVTGGLLMSIAISFSLAATGRSLIYFIVAFFAVYTGLFMIISHRKIFSHLIGFLVVENAVLLLSLAIGAEIPMLINVGILLDIFVSVLILGIFMMRLKQSVHELTMLRDE